jgi:hypothetical protein
MTLEHQVCSLDLAKRLKALGVKQESYAVWNSRHIWLSPFETLGVGTWNEEDIVSAFTVAELGEMVRTFQMPGGNTNDGTWNFFTGKEVFVADTEADARAKMLVYILENKLVTV